MYHMCMSHYIYMYSYKQRTSPMKSTDNNEETSRPFGFWLKAVDRLMAAEFATAFESEGITRRDWRALNVIDGSVAGDARPFPTHKLRRLIERGWVTDADGTLALTDAGRDAKERLGSIVEGIRAKVTDAVPADDLATTVATLEQLARAFGWDENTPLPHRGGHGGRGRGFGGRGFGGRGFGGRGFGGRGFGGHGNAGHGHCGHDHGHGEHGHAGYGHDHGHREHGHGRARIAQFAQTSYERGFDAGFTRGRDDR